jgi:hypothetical protein
MSKEFSSGLTEDAKKKAQKELKFTEIRYDTFADGFKGRLSEIDPPVWLGNSPNGVSKEAMQKAMISPGEWIKVAQGEVYRYPKLQEGPMGEGKPKAPFPKPPEDVPYLDPQFDGAVKSILRDQEILEAAKKKIGEKKAAFEAEADKIEKEYNVPGLKRKIQEETNRLGPVIEALDTVSEAIYRSTNGIYVAVWRKVTTEVITPGLQEKLNEIKRRLLEASPEISRIVNVGMAQWEKANTVIDTVKEKHLRMYPVPKTGLSLRRAQFLGIWDSVVNILSDAYRHLVSFIKELFGIVSELEELQAFAESI